MGDPNAPALDGLALIETLDRHGVDYVLVGGLAATVHGATRLTTDMDVVPQWTTSNHARLASALRELNGGLRIEGVGDPVDYPLDERTFTAFEVSTWRTDLGDLDVIIGIPTHKAGQLRGFDDLVTSSETFRIGTSEVRVGSLDHIVESKAALGRPSDLVALDELRQMQHRQHTEATAESTSESDHTNMVAELSQRTGTTQPTDTDQSVDDNGLNYPELAQALVKETLLTKANQRGTITNSGQEDLGGLTSMLNGVAVKLAATPTIRANKTLNREVEHTHGSRPDDNDQFGQQSWDVHLGRAVLITNTRPYLPDAIAALIVSHHETSHHHTPNDPTQDSKTK